jgi:hypothetical protein
VQEEVCMRGDMAAKDLSAKLLTGRSRVNRCCKLAPRLKTATRRPHLLVCLRPPCVVPYA